MSTIIQTVLFRRTWEMGKSREEAAETRKRIVQAAARQFRETEIAATGLAELMKAAGLTHGGVYKHLASKDRLGSGMNVKRHAIGTPDPHRKGAPPRRWDRLVPVANRRVPHASRSALTSGA